MNNKLSSQHLNLAWIAFAGLVGELLIYVILQRLIPFIALDEGVYPFVHWSLVSLFWGSVSFWIIRKSKRQFATDVLTQRSPVKLWQWFAVFVLVVLSFLRSYFGWSGFKVLKEFQYLGLLRFTFQYIYYIFEMLIATLIIVFSQRAGELRFKKMNIPYGGIFAALTWGAVHFITKGFSVWIIGTCIQSFIFGVAYLLLGKDIKKSYIIILLMFVI